MRLIDADALCEGLVSNHPVVIYAKNAPTVDAVPLEDYKSMERTINKLTKAIAEAEPVRHGHWIEQEGYDGDVYYDCSICGNSWITIDGTPQDNGMNYCPHCGAKMDEPI